MFLGQLSEKEKNAFISLSIHASNSNGVFANEEKVMIQDYCKEMGIPFFNAENAIPMPKVPEMDVRGTVVGNLLTDVNMRGKDVTESAKAAQQEALQLIESMR